MINKKKHYSTRPLLLALSLVGSLSLVSNISLAQISSVDWDNDGLTDIEEERIGSSTYLSDTDGDGISDKDEVGDVTKPRDTDRDGRIDVLDIDDDGDGIPTAVEKSTDSDKDGKADYLDTDSDADGLADSFEVRLTGRDRNKDGIDDLFDVAVTKGIDANGDGIDDNITLVDTNKNGIPDIIDNKTTIPHLAIKSKNQPSKTASQKSKQAAIAKLVTVSAAKLPTRQRDTSKKIEHNNKNTGSIYLEKKRVAGKNDQAYGGDGYFYCANSGKVVKGIKGFMMTSSNEVALLRDASEGDYQWQSEEPGTYAMQFQIPNGMSIVSGLAKGRRIVKEGDSNPLILGGGKDANRSGYLLKSTGKSNVWYTSFEIKDNAPYIKNNNVPLSGGVCNQ